MNKNTGPVHTTNKQHTEQQIYNMFRIQRQKGSGAQTFITNEQPKSSNVTDVCSESERQPSYPNVVQQITTTAVWGIGESPASCVRVCVPQAHACKMHACWEPTGTGSHVRPPVRPLQSQEISRPNCNATQHPITINVQDLVRIGHVRPNNGRQ